MFTDERETVVDFTAPYWLESLTLVSRAPRQRDRSLAVFWPFTARVSYTIFYPCHVKVDHRHSLFLYVSRLLPQGIDAL